MRHNLQASARLAFDAGTNTTVDSISGMSVTFVRYDHPAEKRQFYSLIWQGRESRFTVDWDAGFNRLTAENPGRSIREIAQMMHDLNHTEYNIKLPKDLLDDPDFLKHVDIFIELFAENVRCRLRRQTVTVIFEPDGLDGAFRRRVTYPPMLAPS